MIWLDLEALPDDVAVGHVLEAAGKINHNEAAASGMNSYARAYLREAEAFAAGMAAGRRENRGE
ncbi:hypothetical protein M3G00_07935 [Brevibacterium casei]|uniref:hypothetical protein n=1 Tax=Brevibacterium casei TaxID=33889 RepID=UPI00223BF244|nr:hypothetical protein [Brevibacterium casei]MCT2182865.1 hypothetical protein [Brevibacterium casei]